MAFVRSTLSRCWKAIGALSVFVLLSACPGPGRGPTPPSARADDAEPIAYVGHGAFFERNGRQIVPTVAFVERAQAWYRRSLLAAGPPQQRDTFAAFEERLFEGVGVQGQARLILQQRALEWLLAHSPSIAAGDETPGKVHALGYRLQWRLARSDDPAELLTIERFVLDPALVARLALPEFDPGIVTVLQQTSSGGQAYIDECVDAGVPRPPDIGTAGWRSVGFIPRASLFIVNPRVELQIHEAPTGLCMALPRYADNDHTEVAADGIVCLSRTTSKACFWDNQRNGEAFSFRAGTVIPIGVPRSAGGLYMAGGAELEFGIGGVCTDCHAGENPYIIHPLVELESPSPLDPRVFVANRTLMGALGVQTFAPERYDPIVPASWPQNALSLSPVYVPGGCSFCHVQGSAGRLPHLSTQLRRYCGEILPPALARTMPLESPGSLTADPMVVALREFCTTAPTSDPSNRGEPHLVTTNGVGYDFQAAGEFVSLRNSSNGFELQTRQTPVPTRDVPGLNAHTGLATCASLNTAAAVRLGRHRISYQPAGRLDRAESLQLRLDGRLVELPAAGIDLGSGDRIARAATGGGIDIRAADGTRVIITPNFWPQEGYWFLNIEILGTPAREGTMGHIAPFNWLPFAPNGASFGRAPAAPAARHALLNRRFADAWRVTRESSLFDYGPGTSTATYTDRNWPALGGACTATRVNPWPGGSPRLPVAPMQRVDALRLCTFLERDAQVFDNCMFDMTATGNPGVAQAYFTTLELRWRARR